MKKEILIIDDDLNYVAIITKFLIDKGFDVGIATTYHKINVYLKKSSLKVILIDVLMNNKDGLDILKRLNYEVKIPLIVISQGKDVKLIEKSFQNATYDYLIKPLNLKDLTNKISYAIDQTLCKKAHHV